MHHSLITVNTVTALNSVPELSTFVILGKCSKILNTSCRPKRQRQTLQTQIRLFLKTQSDQGLPCLLLGQPFCKFHCDNQHFI